MAVLAPLSPSERRQLLADVELVRWSPDTAVVRQGAAGSSLFVVVAGLLRVDDLTRRIRSFFELR